MLELTGTMLVSVPFKNPLPSTTGNCSIICQTTDRGQGTLRTLIIDRNARANQQNPHPAPPHAAPAAAGVTAHRRVPPSNLPKPMPQPADNTLAAGVIAARINTSRLQVPLI